MNSHKERLKTIAGKDSTLNKHSNRNSTLNRSRRSNSRLTDNAAKIHRSKSENTYSDEDVESNDRRSPLYVNIRKEHRQEGSESSNLSEDDQKRNTKSSNRLSSRDRVDHQSRQMTLKSNGTKPYHTMNGSTLYKSRSLNAIEAAKPSGVLKKSSVQQEYHDKAVQEYFKGITYGKARRPCRIATVMFVLFGLFFLIGLIIIGLTYLYQNIMPTLDIGVGVGPSLLACSFIFLGVGIKFIYDANKISRKERRRIVFKAYDSKYVGVRGNNHNPMKANEKLVSGSSTDNALSRLPNKINTLSMEDRILARSTDNTLSRLPNKTNILSMEDRTLVRSTQSSINTRTEKSSDI